MGPDEQNNILHGWYTRSVGRAVLTKNSNKANADLNEDRSTEFLKEVEASTSKTFFPKFKMKLRAILGVDLEYAFTAKWSQIEKAFYNALGTEQAVKRLSTFFEQGPSSFTNKPVEQIISDIDLYVDKTFGKTCATYIYSKQRVHSLLTSRLVMKYGFIFQVAQNLPI